MRVALTQPFNLASRREMVCSYPAADQAFVFVGDARHGSVCSAWNVLCVQVDSDISQLSALIFENRARIPWLDWIVRHAAKLDVSPWRALNRVARAGLHADHACQCRVAGLTLYQSERTPKQHL